MDNVADLGSAFGWASSFNQDLSDWRLDSVTNMEAMFYKASVFNQDLGWCLDDDVNLGSYAFVDSSCASTSCGVGVKGVSCALPSPAPTTSPAPTASPTTGAPSVSPAPTASPTAWWEGTKNRRGIGLVLTVVVCVAASFVVVFKVICCFVAAARRRRRTRPHRLAAQAARGAEMAQYPPQKPAYAQPLAPPPKQYAPTAPPQPTYAQPLAPPPRPYAPMPTAPPRPYAPAPTAPPRPPTAGDASDLAALEAQAADLEAALRAARKRRAGRAA